MSSPPCDSFDYPRATLLCRPNSHPFQERNLNLSQAVKIGRSVARDRVMSTNAIFECKVLSRNHALMWYENGKFFLQDTKSSNGTFVNNQRLSLGGIESQPHEICSGDVVQFGVDVIENTRKVTHGCIVATLKLYLSDGTEAKASQISNISQSHGFGAINTAELYQLNQYIQEATRREQQLESKLGHLQRIVESTKSLAQQAWHCLLQEDLLLTRIDTLESQLQVFSSNSSEDKLRLEMVQLLDDKLKYQQAAKESLRNAVEEKLGVVQRCSTLEIALCSTEEERDYIQRALTKTQEELQQLATQLISAQNQIQDLQSQCERVEQMRTQHEVLRIQISECRHNESLCQAKCLCAQAKLAVLTEPLAVTTKNTKSEGDILDNESYQVNHESLLSKIDIQIDLLQRRLMELTSANIKIKTENARIKSPDFSEEHNITVIENDSTMCLNKNNTDDTNNRNSESENFAINSSRDIFKSNYENFEDSNMQDSNNMDNSRQSEAIEQISLALLELRDQRENLVLSQQKRQLPNYETHMKEGDISFKDKDLNESVPNINNVSQQEQQIVKCVEWESENENLKATIESSRSQMEIYEREIVSLNHKLESLDIELQTRPSYNSLQEKELMCAEQKLLIENLTSEQEVLRKEITTSKMTETDLQSQLDCTLVKVHDLEMSIKKLETCLKDKDECINHLKEELMSQTRVEKMISNENSSVQTDCVVEKIAETQTPHQEYADFENSIQKDFEFLTDPDVELQEELVAIKEKLTLRCEENTMLIDKIQKLQLDYDSAIRQSRTMILVYLAPFLALVLYILLSPYMNVAQH